MKKTHTWAVVAVVAIVIIGGYFFITSDAGDTWWEQEWNSVDPNIDGSWKLELFGVTSTGERVTLENTPELVVKHNDIIVSSFEYVLSAKATTGGIPGTFTACEIDMQNMRMILGCVKNAGVPYPLVLRGPYYGTVTIPVDTGVYQEVLTWSAPTGIVEICDTAAPWFVDTSPWADFTAMTDGWEPGFWTWSIAPLGSIRFRGISAETGHGDWNEATSPGGFNAQVNIGQYNVGVDWSGGVTWTPA